MAESLYSKEQAVRQAEAALRALQQAPTTQDTLLQLAQVRVCFNAYSSHHTVLAMLPRSCNTLY